MAPFLPVNGLPLPETPTPATEASPTIEARQSEETPTCESPGGTVLSAGALAGIVIGTIAGTLLMLWLIKSCIALGGPTGDNEKVFRHVEPDHRRRHRSKRRSHSRRRSVDLDVPPATYYKETSGGSRGRKYYV